MKRFLLSAIILLFSTKLVFSAPFDKSSYTVVSLETSSATKQNNMLTSLESSINNVNSAQIVNGTIVNADIADNTIDLTAKVTGILPVENGGTELSTITDGAIMLGSGTDAVTPLAVTTDGAIVIGDGTTDPTILNAFSSATGVLNIENGGTELSTITDGAIMLGSGTDAVTPLVVTTDGAIVIGDGTTDPTILTAFTGSAGTLKHESGGIETDISAITTDNFLVGTSAGVIGIENAVTAVGSLGFTATTSEVNQALDGVSANVTDTNLNTLTAGTTSSSNSLHAHPSNKYTASDANPGTTTSIFAHNLGYIPSVTWTKSADGRADITALSTTGVTITVYGGAATVTVYCV